MNRLSMWIAWRLPKSIRMWVVVRAYAAAWEHVANKTPDQLTYSEVYREVA